ncbi:MAG TPA: MFS transporter, partial [Solirubrobacteraceae bacterium]|nr:MFS transporter [Solirubrobacteraceae bacterium]
AILSPAALSIVTTTFTEGAERNKALGVWGAVAGSGGAAGVLLGGVLTDALSWEWVLFVNVPIGLAAAAVAPYLLADTRDTDRHRSFDAAGAVTITAGLSILVYALVDAEDAGWGSTQTIVLLAVAALLHLAFVAIESRAQSPLVPFAILRNRTLTASNAVGLLIGMALFSMFFFVSLYMQNVLGFDALETGLAYLPLALTIIVSAGVASQLSTRFGFKPVLMGGLLLVAGGLVWFSQVSVGGSYTADVLFPSLLAGAGLGFAFVPVTIGAVTGTREEESGLASGLINTSQQIGGALGLAVLATVAFSGLPEGAPDLGALTAGFRDAFLVGATFALAAFLIAALAIRTRDSEAMKGAEAPAPAAA